MKKTITYYYRGEIETGKNYHWVYGYSANGENGGVLYPWWTKKQCQKDAKSKGCKAVFVG
jgi:hypothetical protein